VGEATGGRRQYYVNGGINSMEPLMPLQGSPQPMRETVGKEGGGGVWSFKLKYSVIQ
jgi:hypothetical protein